MGQAPKFRHGGDDLRGITNQKTVPHLPHPGEAYLRQHVDCHVLLVPHGLAPGDGAEKQCFHLLPVDLVRGQGRGVARILLTLRGLQPVRIEGFIKHGAAQSLKDPHGHGGPRPGRGPHGNAERYFSHRNLGNGRPRRRSCARKPRRLPGSCHRASRGQRPS